VEERLGKIIFDEVDVATKMIRLGFSPRKQSWGLNGQGFIGKLIGVLQGRVVLGGHPRYMELQDGVMFTRV
jgi:hypothetical protein